MPRPPRVNVSDRFVEWVVDWPRGGKTIMSPRFVERDVEVTKYGD